MRGNYGTQRGVRAIVLIGLTAMVVVGMLGLAPGLSSHLRVQARAPVGVSPGTASAAPATAPSIAAYHPYPSLQQQRQMVPSPPHVTLGKFALKGPHPASWGPAGIPPGAGAIVPSSQSSGGTGSSSGYTGWNNRLCAGLWPQFESYEGSSSQGAYAAGCYGHDEPGMQFFSDLPGSGGNVTWNVTLPTDRDATHNQSDLYAAIWFGMTMTDPYGWMDQCFLELQFYPDQLFTNPGPQYPNWTVNGKWIGAAVAWQIEASTGFEDPCFYEPLYVNGTPGPGFLNMTQGDHLTVTMTGWANDPTGEVLNIVDHTSGQMSTVTMYNSFQGYPIDPAYSMSNTEASMQWTPGGEFPVSFAFETGHAGNPTFPSNNSYGGCSGGSHSTPQDPGAPCPSYDPSSWANDTLTPWHWQVPTFFNAHAVSHPVQVSFTQPEGGISLVDQTSNGACSGIEGSAWCSYPFYSYYCGSHTFEFGAADYTGVTSDFGKWSQFDTNFNTLSFGGTFFPPTNFSIPTCGAPSATVSFGPSVAGAGSVYFLSQADSAVTSVSGLAHGTYSLNAIPKAGTGFAHWVTTGGASVGITTSPYTTLHITGSGTVRAVFTAKPAKTAVTFKDVGKGSVGLDPNFLWIGDDQGLSTVVNGAAYSLPAGVYSIQAYPAPGWNFSFWSSGGGVTVAAPQWPYTQLIVTGKSGFAAVTAWYTKTTTNGTLYLYSIGVGSASFGSLTVANSNPFGYSAGVATMAAGTYPITIVPGAGVLSWQILYGPPLIISNNSVNTYGTLENGTAVLEVLFTSGAQVTFHTNPSKGGTIYAQAGAGLTAVPHGATVTLPLGTYAFAAAAASGYAFAGWSTGTPRSVAFYGTTTPWAFASVFANGSITANFLKTGTTANLTFRTGGTAGTITYNVGSTYTNGTVLTHTTAGGYVVTANAPPNWVFVGWRTAGSIALTGSSGSPTTTVALFAGTAALWAYFAPVVAPLSFVVWDPAGTTPVHGGLHVNGGTLHTGDTMWLRPGTYSVTLSSPRPLASWSAIGGVTIVTSNATAATLTVTTGGTIEAVL